MAIAKKKKKFWDVEIPLIRKTTQLYAMELEELEGKRITYDLTRMLRGKSVIFSGVVEVKNDEATTLPLSMKILPYFLKRMVRKGTDYIEDSFQTECKDAILTIKPLLVSRRRISKVVRRALRNKAKEELIAYVKNKKAEVLFEDIMRNQLQRSLSLKLKKVYPLSLCEIRVFKVDEMTAKAPTEEVAEKPKEKKAEEIAEKPKKKVAKKKTSKKEETTEKEE